MSSIPHSKRKYRPKATGVAVRKRTRLTPMNATQIYGSTGSELKFIDITAAPAVITTAGSLELLSQIANGNGQSERVGRRINLVDIHLRFSLYPSDDFDSNYSRVLMFIDKQSNGAAPAITDVLTTSTYYSLLNPININRFQVLYDSVRHSTFNNNATLSIASTPTHFIETRKSLKGRSIMFKGTGSTVSSIDSGAVYLLTISSSAAMTYQTTSRLRYTDA